MAEESERESVTWQRLQLSVCFRSGVLKWLHMNMGIKYSRWEKHLEMLAVRDGCFVIWSTILCLDRLHMSEGSS